MLLDWLGFILVSWLIVGAVSGVALLFPLNREFLEKQFDKEAIFRDMLNYISSEGRLRIVRVLAVLIGTVKGPLTLVDFYKTQKEVRKLKRK